LEGITGNHQVQPPAQSKVNTEFRPGPLGLLHLQGWQFHIISGQPASKFDSPHGETFFSIQNLPFQFMKHVFSVPRFTYFKQDLKTQSIYASKSAFKRTLAPDWGMSTSSFLQKELLTIRWHQNDM